MAIVTAQRQLDMSLLGSGSHNSVSANSFFVSGSYYQKFSGTYVVTSAGTLNEGDVTSLIAYNTVVRPDNSVIYIQAASITGLSLDAAYVYDLVSLGQATALQELMFSGNDSIAGSIYGDFLHGYAGDDSINGGDGNDFVTGGAGADTLDGGFGRDTLTGGAGDDTFYVDRFADAVFELSDEGLDRVYSSVSFTIGDHVEELVLVGSSTISGTGNELANYLLGNSANNTLYGLAGNDTLNGGGGIDTLDGGEGNDTYVVDSTTDVIVDSSGTDSVLSSVSYSLASRAGIENLILVGSSAMSGTGNTQDNTITASIGDTTINGGSGSDTADYSNASSAIAVSLAVTGAQSTGGSGSDTLVSVENITGSRYADLLTGSDSANLIAGAAGNDTIDGGAGNDSLNGSTGNDSLYGGAGNDTLWGGLGSDIHDGGAGTDTVTYADASQGVRVRLNLSSAQNTRGAGSDTLINVENILGSIFDDYLLGNSADNYLDGGQGNDTMHGGGGNDVFVVDSVDDKAVEYQGAGIDEVRSSISFDLMLHPAIENVTLTGSDDLSVLGNHPNTASDGDNVLVGNSGNNSIWGGGGDDTMTGGDGRDVFRFNDYSSTDTITDFDVAEDIIELEYRAPLIEGGEGIVFNIDNIHHEPANADDVYFDQENFRIINGQTDEPSDDGTPNSFDYIVYDDVTGYVYYDPDGDGILINAHHFITLDSGLKALGLSAGNFEIMI